VAVFAASTFPLAFSVLGGDTPSALAAGGPSYRAGVSRDLPWRLTPEQTRDAAVVAVVGNSSSHDVKDGNRRSGLPLPDTSSHAPPRNTRAEVKTSLGPRIAAHLPFATSAHASHLSGPVRPVLGSANSRSGSCKQVSGHDHVDTGIAA
jgi:hypothetical protein